METGRTRSPILNILVIAIIALAAFGLGAGTMYVMGQSRNASPATVAGTDGGTQQAGDTQMPDVPKDINEEFKPFWETYQAINEQYYNRPIDRQKMIYGATKGMMQSLGDDYSAFLTPQEASGVESTMQGNFEGVGMYFEKRNDIPTVVSPIPDTPAERAGIRAKDLILAVDGRDITQLTTDQIAGLIRGQAGTKVRLTMRRGNQPNFDLELTRQKIEVPAVTLKMVENNVAHIEVNIFGDKTVTELDNALKEATGKNASGIILDLRNNGGGYVVAAQSMLGRFLPEGKVALYEAFKADGSQDKPQLVITGDPKLLDIPLVVLVNGGTASASEIVSGALQDYGRAKLIGEQTFGKGSVQNVLTLSDGSSARVTIAHWLTPKKRDINPKPPQTNANGTPVLPTFTPAPQVTALPVAATATAEARPLIPTLKDRGLTPDIEVIRTEK
ncbi:MAG TPA: S41 family peptidase, partial [Chloroflexia bacterium]|nr:S41 family peptidase [Chloroflexia bacterium]